MDETVWDAVAVPQRCRSYLPGHSTHPVMVKHVRPEGRHPVVIRDVVGNTAFVEVGGEVEEWHHHEPDNLMFAWLAWPDRFVTYGTRALLVAEVEPGREYWIYCSRDPLGPCTPGPIPSTSL